MLGAVLLGAEAVTLARVRRFREALLGLRGRVLRAVFIPYRQRPSEKSFRDRVSVIALYFVIITIAFPVEYGVSNAAFGVTPDDIAGDIASGNAWWEHVLYWIILDVIGGFAMAVAALAVALVVSGILTGGARLLLTVDRHTPTGGVGVIGVVLLLMGFMGQLVAAWV